VRRPRAYYVAGTTCVHMHMRTCVHVCKCACTCACTCTLTCTAFARRARPTREWPRRGQIALSLSRRRSSERCASVYPSPSQVSPPCERTSAHAHIGQATVEHFVSRVFDIARPFQSFITSVRLQFNSLSELWPTHPPCTPSPPPSPHTIGVHPVIPKVCPSTRDLMILHALHGLRDSPSRTVLRIRRRRSAWQATCAHAAPKARCSQLILVTSIITHLQIRMSHLSR